MSRPQKHLLSMANEAQKRGMPSTKRVATPAIDLLVRRSVSPTLRKYFSKKQFAELSSKIFITLNCPDIELSVLLTDDREIRTLNRDFRFMDKATDVLSFPLQHGKAGAQLAGSLGDLVISLETTIRQAKTFGVTVQAELLRLLIHGTLHLLGYDHERVSKAEAQRMRRKEEKLMQLLAPEIDLRRPRRKASKKMSKFKAS